MELEKIDLDDLSTRNMNLICDKFIQSLPTDRVIFLGIEYEGTRLRLTLKFIVDDVETPGHLRTTVTHSSFIERPNNLSSLIRQLIGCILTYVVHEIMEWASIDDRWVFNPHRFKNRNELIPGILPSGTYVWTDILRLVLGQLDKNVTSDPKTMTLRSILTILHQKVD